MAEAVRVDVAVVGAGPAGIAAAVVAAERGARVALLDEAPEVGGQIWRRRPGGPPPPAARAWCDRLARSSVLVRTRATVVDAEPGGRLLAETPAGAVHIEAERIVIATGARERFVPFPGWTLPNVMGIGAVQALLKTGASFLGRRVVVAGSGPLLLPVAALLVRDGAEVRLVAEQAPAGSVIGFGLSLLRRPASIVDAARYRLQFLRTPYRTGVWAIAAEGRDFVERVVLTDGRRQSAERCDLLACAHGLVPNVELARLLGCHIEDGAVAAGNLQQTSVAGVFVAGEPAGVAGVEVASAEGQIAGFAATGARAGERVPARWQRTRDSGRAIASRMEAAFRPRRELCLLACADTVVCRCEDVVRGAIDDAWSARQAKLYTRAGMGACQGRVCGPALELLLGFGSDTTRAPVKLARVDTLAGRGDDGAS